MLMSSPCTSEVSARSFQTAARADPARPEGDIASDVSCEHLEDDESDERAEDPAEGDLGERVNACLDPGLRHEQRHDERQRADQEPVLEVAENRGDRHPAA